MSIYGAAWREGGTLVRSSLLTGARAGEMLVRGLGAPTLVPSAEALRATDAPERWESWVAAYDRAREPVDGMPLASLFGLAAGDGPAWTVLEPLARARGWSPNALVGLRDLRAQGSRPGLAALLQWDRSRRAWLAARLARPSPVAPEPPSGSPPPSSGLSGLGLLVVLGLVVFAARTALDPRATRWGV